MKVVFELSRTNASGSSLGALIAMGRRHEQVEGEAASYAYYFVLTDGHLVDCEARVYDKILDYVDRLELIPVEEGCRREADSRYHRLELLQYKTPQCPRHYSAGQKKGPLWSMAAPVPLRLLRRDVPDLPPRAPAGKCLVFRQSKLLRNGALLDEGPGLRNGGT